MKLAFIVPRYGPDIVDGGEHLCRLVAERLAGRHDVEVLTTCARDAGTWRNVFAEGADRVRGVIVRRFASSRVRDAVAFASRSRQVVNQPHTRADEMAWLEQLGPWCPALIEYLRRSQQQYDALVFFSDMAATTVSGLGVNPGKSVVVSTTRGEGFFGLDIYKDVFAGPAATCFVTDSDRAFVEGLFRERALLQDVVGLGVDVLPPQTYPRMPLADDDEPGVPPAEIIDDMAPGGVPQAGPGQSRLASRGAVFRRRYRLPAPLILHAGRIEPGHGCEELVEYFLRYREQGGDATLALMGTRFMALPEDQSIRLAGVLSDQERAQAVAAATVVVCPSPHASLSLVALEALAMGTPILVNARSESLVDYCRESNAGLWYADADEFRECATLLTNDAALNDALGRNGVEYARTHCDWERVLGNFERVFSAVRHAR